ncbi:peroxiredoxin-like family protein [Kordiimonas aestuarii]|uniref:peroxiredoxin-like family protein n=1 Tax=Kordiimonas aestuarii TaxID=1005925 RepID=UPI0021D012CB|nr:peroxiredoxin-like family protein [Kordiimonas aestuarii]
MPTLNAKIRDAIQHFRGTLPPEITSLIEQGAGEISALDIVERALRPKMGVPGFELEKYGGGTGKLKDYLDRGPLVLTFYRGVWCPYCNLQLREYDGRLHEITRLGASLVAVTPEMPGAVDRLQAAGVPEDVISGAVTSVGFDVLHDAGNTLAEKCGLVFELPKSHRDVLDQIGIDVKALTGNGSYMVADPATYVVGQDGLVFRAFVPNNYRKRTEVDSIIEALRDLAQADGAEKAYV